MNVGQKPDTEQQKKILNRIHPSPLRNDKTQFNIHNLAKWKINAIAKIAVETHFRFSQSKQ